MPRRAHRDYRRIFTMKGRSHISSYGACRCPAVATPNIRRHRRQRRKRAVLYGTCQCNTAYMTLGMLGIGQARRPKLTLGVAPRRPSPIVLV